MSGIPEAKPSGNIVPEVKIIYSRFYYLYENGGYTGLDFGPGCTRVICKIRFMPVLNIPYLMLGGKFQGSNISSSEGYEDLYIIKKTPRIGWNEVLLDRPKAYRYIRYLGPPGSHCQLSRVEYYACCPAEGSADPQKLSGIPFGTGPALNPGQEYDVVYREGPPVLLSFKESAETAGYPVYMQNNKGDLFFHQHDFIEMTYIISGSAFHINTHAIDYLFAGDLVIIPPGVMHAYIGSSNLNFIDLLFYPELLPSRDLKNILDLSVFSHLLAERPAFTIRDKQEERLHLYLSRQKKILPLMEAMCSNFQTRQPGYLLSSYGMFLQWLVLLNEIMEEMKGGIDAGASEDNIKLIQELISYLEQNYRTITNIEAVINHFPVSYSRLSHLFKAETGISIIEYLNRIRIGIAGRRLIRSSDKLAAIASGVGFNNYSNFARLFKQYLNCAPLDFHHTWRCWFT
ncbi:MAG: AraC family transcriptional regulator [Bacillota bacterium]